MADNKTTPVNQELIPETKLQTAEIIQEKTIGEKLNQFKNTVSLLTTLTLSLGVSSAQAGELPKEIQAYNASQESTSILTDNLVKYKTITIASDSELNQILDNFGIKNIPNVIEIFHTLDTEQQKTVSLYYRTGIEAPKDGNKVGKGLENLVMGFNATNKANIFLANPSYETLSKGTTAMSYYLASKGYKGADLIVTEKMIAQAKSTDTLVTDLKKQVYDKKIEVVDKKIEVVDKKIEVVDKKIEVVDKKIEVVDKKLEVVDKKLETANEIIALGKDIVDLGNDVIDNTKKIGGISGSINSVKK